MNFKGIAALLLVASAAGCSTIFRNPFSSGGDDGRPEAVPARVIEATAKFALAVGGVAPGRDELVLRDSAGDARDLAGHTLECAPDDPILLMRPRPGFATQAEGSGVQMVAIAPGLTAVRCSVDGAEEAEVFEVTIPPQELIQILVAEAGQQLADEAQIDEASGAVALESDSPTAEALGSAIRNRVELTNSLDDPGLFEADARSYDADPPASYYEAIVVAAGQFSPTDPQDPSNAAFERAQDRNFLDGDWVVAYDQAVLTAAGIFNGDIADTTGGSFAFRSPSDDEWVSISGAWTVHSIELPTGAGFADATFPRLSPIQLLIHPNVWRYGDGRPAFVFARSRTEADYAIVNTP